MAGKWSFLKGQVAERDPNDMPGYAERYAERKAALAGLNFEELSNALTDAKERKDDISAKLSDASLDVTVLERLVIEKLEAAGLESVVAGGYRLTPSVEPNFSKEDGSKLREWCKATGQEELLTVNAQTLSSIAKEHFLEYGTPPPGVKLSGIYTKLSRTKQK